MSNFCGSLLTAIIFLLHHVAFGQNQEVKIGITTTLGKSTGRTAALSANRASSVQLALKKKLNSEDSEWIRKLNAEYAGAEIIYADLDGIVRGEGYGKSIGIVSTVDFRLLRKNSLALYFTPGVGISYLTKTTFTHPQTFIFGSHLNGTVKAKLSAEIEASENVKISLNSQFLHFSNGGFQLPNAGVNILSFGLGIAADFNSGIPQKKAINPIKNSTKNTAEFSAGIGKRGKYKIRESDDLRLALYGGYRHRLNEIFTLKAGIDAVYFPNIYNPEEYVNTVIYHGASNEKWRIGGRFSGEVALGKLAVSAGVGRYLYFKSPYDQKIYWITSLRYHFSPKLGAEAALHVNRFQADFASGGLFFIL